MQYVLFQGQASSPTAIEVIISNNDAMAIGAIEALQKYGYNKEDKSNYVSVVGIDVLPEAKDLCLALLFEIPKFYQKCFIMLG
ncbi:substrate-binding domain-containing protein [Clostridium beijerinckii]|uniref:substrate-binding domain-containing protein n=1 Tax=Clostridium beijerinckii TaxID=1520 RepID=UPI0017AB030F|nr:substrate-binding domain-containing protein [Clostridium beijerinckii]NOW06708.1 DNA-binding LacI/PurR family transcriptional regulator [Clostridium beijerinckii]NYC00147.1 DNA-binding LacI/PurR family transcriptional regulator [Clostridium beijerinckii]